MSNSNLSSGHNSPLIVERKYQESLPNTPQSQAQSVIERETLISNKNNFYKSTVDKEENNDKSFKNNINITKNENQTIYPTISSTLPEFNDITIPKRTSFPVNNNTKSQSTQQQQQQQQQHVKMDSNTSASSQTQSHSNQQQLQQSPLKSSITTGQQQQSSLLNTNSNNVVTENNNRTSSHPNRRKPNSEERAQNRTFERRDTDELYQSLYYYAKEIFSIIRPVILCIVLSIVWVKLTINVDTSQIKSTDINIIKGNNGGGGSGVDDSSGSNYMGFLNSLLNAGIIIGNIVIATFFILILFKYNCTRVKQ